MQVIVQMLWYSVLPMPICDVRSDILKCIEYGYRRRWPSAYDYGHCAFCQLEGVARAPVLLRSLGRPGALLCPYCVSDLVGPTMAMIAYKCPDIEVVVVDINAARIEAWNSDVTMQTSLVLIEQLKMNPYYL